MFAAFLCTIFFSISAISGHRSARRMGGTEANFWRVSVAALLLGVWAFTMGQGLVGHAFTYFVLSGLLGIGFGDIALFQALPRLGPRLTSLIFQCFSAPFGALIEWIWIGTVLSSRQIGFAFLILAGVVVALKPTEGVRIPPRTLLAGAAACCIAAAFNAMGAVMSRKAYAVSYGAGEVIDPGTAGFQRVLAGAILAGIFLLIVKRKEWRVQSRAPGWMVAQVSRQKWAGIWPWVLLNGLAGQTLGVSFMQLALETTPAGLVLAIIAATPIVVIPFAFVFEKERPTVSSVAGAFIAIAGVIGLIQRA